MKFRGLLASLLMFTAMVGTAQASWVTIEDFEDGNVSEYSGPGVGSAIVSGTYAHDGSFGLGTQAGDWLYRTDAQVQVAQGDTLSAWISFDRTNDGRAYFGFGSSAAGTLSLVLGANTGEFIIQENAGFGFSNIGAVGQSYLSNHWYRVELAWGLGGSITGQLFDSDGTTLLNTVNANSNLYTSGGIAFRGFSGVKGFDTIQKLDSSAVPEPVSVAVWGAGAIGMAIARRRRTQTTTNC